MTLCLASAEVVDGQAKPGHDENATGHDERSAGPDEGHPAMMKSI